MKKMKLKNSCEFKNSLILTNRALKAEYEAWVVNMLKNYYRGLYESDNSWDSWLSQSVFFTTITFDQELIHNRKDELMIGRNDRSIEWDDQHALYCFVVEKLYGRNWMRMKDRRRLPLMVAGLDFEGSRFGALSEDKMENAHIHAIWAFPSDEVSGFLRAIASPEYNLKLKDKLHIDRIEIERFAPTKASVQKLGSYALKSNIRTQRLSVNAEMIRIYPDRNFGFKPYRADRTYRVESKKLKAIRTAAWREREMGSERPAEL